MEGISTIVLLGALVLALAVAPLVLLAGRRRFLSHQGGAFECSVRMRPEAPGRGWALGLARYNAERFEWFRFFSYSFRPRVSLLRADTCVLGSREPNAAETTVLYADQVVVLIEEQRPSGSREWELAMHSDALTGLLSWLEAAPPGVRPR